MNKLDIYRYELLANMTKSNETFTETWKTDWQALITSKLGPSPSAQSILSLGDELSNIFLSTRGGGREQGSLSGGGAAWECLVSWYLNLVAFGTQILITKPYKNLIPPPIIDSIAVTIASYTANTESDLLVFTLPIDETKYKLAATHPTSKKEKINLKTGRVKIDKEEVFRAQVDTMDESKLSVIQCKTNWNDNAQIPMLWDLIYNQKGSKISALHLGRHGYNVDSFKSFNYAFCTVPTQRRDIKPKSVAVSRVKNLSGGNYWGHKTDSHIALSIQEFFTKNYMPEFKSNILKHISSERAKNPHYLDEFLSLNF